MKFKITIEVPEEKKKPKQMPKECPAEYKRTPLLEKVKEYAECVQSDEESTKEWYYLQSLYERLQKIKKLSPEQKQIIYIIEPLILLFNTNAKEIDGSKMLRGKDYLNKG